MSEERDWSRLGRNNKNRGRAFEKKVARVLNWTRVPGSGSFPGLDRGDVIDGQILGAGFWLAECKSQQPGPQRNVSVSDKAIKQAFAGTNENRRHPLVAVTLHGEVESWVFLPQESWEFLVKQVYFVRKVQLTADVIWTTKTRGNGRGFVALRTMLDEIGIVGLIHVTRAKRSSAADEFDVDSWRVLRLQDFASIVEGNNAYVKPATGDRVKDRKRALQPKGRA